MQPLGGNRTRETFPSVRCARPLVATLEDRAIYKPVRVAVVVFVVVDMLVIVVRAFELACRGVTHIGRLRSSGGVGI